MDGSLGRAGRYTLAESRDRVAEGVVRGRKVCHAGHIKPGEHRRFVGFDELAPRYGH